MYFIGLSFHEYLPAKYTVPDFWKSALKFQTVYFLKNFACDRLHQPSLLIFFSQIAGKVLNNRQ